MWFSRCTFRTFRTHLGFLVLLVLLSLPSGCGSGEESEVAGDLLLDVSAESLYSVGSQAGDRWDALSRVTSVAFGPGGRLHILDADARQVLVVNPDGTHAHTFGTAGEGPGQFRMPISLAALEDGTVVVHDAGHQALLLFDANGAFLRSVPAPPQEGSPGNALLPHGPEAVVSVGRGMIRMERSGSGPPQAPSTAPVRRFDLGEASGVTLHEAWIPPREMGGARPGGGPVGGGPRIGGPGGISFGGSFMRGFEPQTHLAALPDGRLALADSTTYRIRLLGPEGEKVGEITRPLTPRPVSEEDREAERERRLQDLDAGRGPRIQLTMQTPGGTRSVDQSQLSGALREGIQNMDFWPEMSLIAGLRADPEGRLWVLRQGEVGAPGPTDLFSPDGEYLGTIAPDQLTPPDALGPGGLGAWIQRDELEVPFVEVKRVRVES